MTLIARSWISLRRMLISLRQALARRGLALHPSKCKAQTNLESCHRRGEIKIEEGFNIEVLPEGQGLKLLGTVLTLEDTTRHEMRNRIASGWRMFWSMKPLLLNGKVSKKKRLRLLDSTVANCVLWSCQSWTPRVEELKSLRSTQRAMMRKIVGQGRAPEEDWIPWIRRTTKKACDMANECKVRDWVTAHFAGKWSWAGHVARRPSDAWTWKTTTWRDTQWQSWANELGANRPLRPSRRRHMKMGAYDEEILRRA